MKLLRASCDCGFVGTYQSRAKADYALRRHSCDKHRDAAARRARRLAREAAVDRTPKPCLHKIANHRHGTRAAYVLDRCRCKPCSRACGEAEAWRERQKAYGRYDKYVDADEARQYVRDLMAQGMGLKRIVAVSDLSQGMLWKLVYGKRGTDGAQVRSRRILKTTHDRILAVTLDLADGAKADDALADVTTRKVRALVALGWSQSKLAERLDIQRGNFRLADERPGVSVGTARAVAALYDELSMRLPPESTHRDRIAATRARGYAKARGWLPPLAYDEDMTPAESGNEPTLDDQAIWRRMRGDRSVRLRPAEAAELVRRWRESGRPLNECERITGLNAHRYLREAA